MPGRDGTGPLGGGSMTGRGLGLCTGNPCYGSGQRLGFNRGSGRGMRRGLMADPTVSATDKDLLKRQKEMLEGRLKIIGQRLEDL